MNGALEEFRIAPQGLVLQLVKGADPRPQRIQMDVVDESQQWAILPDQNGLVATLDGARKCVDGVAPSRGESRGCPLGSVVEQHVAMFASEAIEARRESALQPLRRTWITDHRFAITGLTPYIYRLSFSLRLRSRRASSPSHAKLIMVFARLRMNSSSSLLLPFGSFSQMILGGCPSVRLRW